jgi:hypothetical protein
MKRKTTSLFYSVVKSHLTVMSTLTQISAIAYGKSSNAAIV